MKRLTIVALKGYQMLLSPLLPFNHCRYYPSCSAYAVEAVEKHGTIRGLYYAARRLMRCHPYSHRHGYDPVP
jgi:putative membrane protein insertion efficiency factor